MKYVLSLAAIAFLASACAVKSERTVVERPAPSSTATTVYTPAVPATSTTVYTSPPPTSATVTVR